jgi:hypothetical protein
VIVALYSKYRDIYLPILHPAVEKPIQLDPKDVRADADWAEEEGVKRAYTEAQRLRSVPPARTHPLAPNASHNFNSERCIGTVRRCVRCTRSGRC